MAVATITERASDFTDRDFDAWILELRNRVPAAFPAWTDYNIPNYGNLILESFAHTLDVLSYTQDQQFKEKFISFAKLRRSMILLGRNVAFTLPGALAASVDLEFTYADGLARTVDLVIPAGTVIRTADASDPVEFDTTADITIPAGQIQATGPAENARSQADPIVTNGDPSQSVLLSAIPYLDNSATVVIGVNTFEEQEDFLSSGPTDRHFVVEVDQDDRATVLFGDGLNGLIPNGSGTVFYKTGGGDIGNVEANTLVEFRDSNRFNDLNGNPAQLLVRNPLAAAGGVDRMSVEEARVAIPESLTTLGNRSVSQQDFEVNARKVRGVARAMMLTSDDDPSIDENRGELYIVPVGGGLASAALKAEVLDTILTDFPPTLTFQFTVEDPSLLVVSFSATVFLNSGITETVARTAIENAMIAFFDLQDEGGAPNLNVDFGFKLRQRQPGVLFGELPWSDLFNAMRDAVSPQGQLVLRKIEEDSFVPVDDVTILDKEFPVLGSIALINGDTGLAF